MNSRRTGDALCLPLPSSKSADPSSPDYCLTWSSCSPTSASFSATARPRFSLNAITLLDLEPSREGVVLFPVPEIDSQGEEMPGVYRFKVVRNDQGYVI